MVSRVRSGDVSSGFRPLAGNGLGKNNAPQSVIGNPEQFPSPCGEWVRKENLQFVTEQGFVVSEFPSPCGEWVRKAPSAPMKVAGIEGFRPLAGNGLGKEMDLWVRNPVTTLACFRPLAGNGLGKGNGSECPTGSELQVSVPLRGMG